MKYFLVNLDRTSKNKEICYWTKNVEEFTTDVEEAGRFEFENAIELAKNDYEMKTGIIPIKENIKNDREA